MLSTEPYERYTKLLSGYIHRREQAVVLKEVILSGKRWLNIDTLARAVAKYGIDYWQMKDAIQQLEFVGVERRFNKSGTLTSVTNKWYESKDADVVVELLDEMITAKMPAIEVHPKASAPPLVKGEMAPKVEKKLHWCDKFLARLGNLFFRHRKS